MILSNYENIEKSWQAMMKDYKETTGKNYYKE